MPNLAALIEVGTDENALALAAMATVMLAAKELYFRYRRSVYRVVGRSKLTVVNGQRLAR